LAGNINRLFNSWKADNPSDTLDSSSSFSKLLNLAEGDGIECIVAFDDNPDDLVGTKYFFEGIWRS
jgi:hypothetical protein